MDGQMNQNEILTTLGLLGNLFDSHDFIRKFILNCPVSYGDLLKKHKKVTTAHGEIANYLGNHSKQLGIEQIGTIVSLNIFNNETPCALWKKNNPTVNAMP